MIKLFVADLKLLLRNKQMLFWSFAFPLIFAAVFGFFFSGGANNNGSVAFIDNAHTTLSQGLRSTLAIPFTVQNENNESDAQTQIKNGKDVGAVIVPAGFGTTSKNVEVLYDPGSAAGRATIDGVVNAFLTEVSFKSQGVQPLYSINDVAAGTSGNTFTYFDYVLVGLLGMSLMNSAIQGLAVSMARYREDQILKRITTTPLNPWVFVISEVLARLVINVGQVLVILAVGVYGFHSTIGAAEFLPLVGLSLVAAVLFQLLGFGVAALSKTTDAAEGMAQAITIPMMFLSGVFFSIDGLPKWLFDIVQFLPLSPLLHIMRSVSLQGGGVFDSPLNVGIIVGWILVLLVFVATRFRMTEE